MYTLKEKGIDMVIASRSPTSDIAKVFEDKLELQPMFVAQGSYLTKADKWVQIKAKQDEDKFAARLHFFSGNSVKPKSSKSPSKKIEMARSLNLIGAPWKNKTLRSDEHKTVVHSEVILCVEIYKKTYAFVKS
ncbi:hypothetical protein Zm00014a_002053 [Zea mays]|uniref:Uncharacterized protein n=1 Tax=Zea mays TaxID=4577 RepID=A0A3L6G7J9_MAIZE|nr:hypothetical protein Zm00014a_002053 [Zea mays]